MKSGTTNMIMLPALLVGLVTWACDDSTTVNVHVGSTDDDEVGGDADTDADTDADADADTDADADADADTDDPLCGALNQPCCDMNSIQPTTCDSPSLTCSMGYPNPEDAYCRHSCTPVPCTTLENDWGACMVGVFAGPVYVGLCIGPQAEACDASWQCQQYFGVASAECISGLEPVPICLDTGCNYQANCPGGHYCSAAYGDACIQL